MFSFPKRILKLLFEDTYSTQQVAYFNLNMRLSIFVVITYFKTTELMARYRKFKYDC